MGLSYYEYGIIVHFVLKMWKRHIGIVRNAHSVQIILINSKIVENWEYCWCLGLRLLTTDMLTLTEPTTKNTTSISAYTRGHETRLDDVTL